MKRHLIASLSVLAAVALAATSFPATAQPKTLKIVAGSDLKILDPTFTTAYISRNFGYMVYDTLFAQDASGKPQPQMVEKYTASKDSRQWSFTLRTGLKFSDGATVTSTDAVASLQRWAARDGMGRALIAAGAVEGDGRPHLHTDPHRALRPGARIAGQAIELPTVRAARATCEDAGECAAA